MTNTPAIQLQPLGTQLAQDPAARQESEAAIPLEWQVGGVILDQYEVTGLLGEGGMGRVYKVHHLNWNIDLAVKTPKKEMVERAGGTQGFVQECETWINLGLHPHIVSCYYVRVLGGVPRVFAEYVSGGSLKDWIRDRRLYEGGKDKALERILDFAIQFAWGLEYAHEQGLVHQDVKPDNVMITPEGLLKVTDFGLAKGKFGQIATSTHPNHKEAPKREGTIVASFGGMTSEYASPEQANAFAEMQVGIPPEQRTPITRKSDVWSWGISILEMFLGEVPGSYGQLAGSYLDSYSQGNLETTVGIPSIPKNLSGLLHQCFENNSDRRPTFSEVVIRLQDIYQQEIGTSLAYIKPSQMELRADSMNNKAVSLHDLGQVEEAIQIWEVALEIDPQHREANYNLGLQNWRMAKITDSDILLRLSAIRESNPDDWKVNYLIAQVHMERGDCEEAIQILQALDDSPHPEIIRLKKQASELLSTSRKCIRTFEGHAGLVNSVSLSTDRRYALSGGNDESVRLWDVATGRCLMKLKGREFLGNSVCVSPDGGFAVFIENFNELKFWDVAAAKLRNSKEKRKNSLYFSSVSFCVGPELILALTGRNEPEAFSSLRGKLWKDFGYPTLQLWDGKTGKCLGSFDEQKTYVTSVCLSPNGRLALSASEDNLLRLWDVLTRKCLQTFVGHTDLINSVSLCTLPVVISGGKDRTVRICDIVTGKCLRTFEGHTDSVNSVGISADGHIAISGSSDNSFRIWDVLTGRCLCTFEKHKDKVASVCLSSDGNFALSGSDSLQLWNIQREYHYNAELSLSLPPTSQDTHIVTSAFSSGIESASLAIEHNQPLEAKHFLEIVRAQQGYKNDQRALQIWHQLYTRLPRITFYDGYESGLLEGHLDDVTSVTISPDGRFALSGSEDKTLRLWDLLTGKCLRSFVGHSNSVSSVCINSESRFALSGSEDQNLRMWDLSTGKCLYIFIGHSHWVSSVSISSDGRYALSGSYDKTLKSWDLAKGNCRMTFKGHSNLVNTVCLFQNNRFALSGSDDKTIRLWDVITGKCLRIFTGHTNGVNSVSLSNTESFAISGGGDNTLRLWNVKTGECLRSFEGHTDSVNSVCISHDERFVLSGSDDKTIRLWDLKTGKCLHIFRGHEGGVVSICLSPDGRFFLSCDLSNNLRKWAMDWGLEEKDPADWDEGALPYIKQFLKLHRRQILRKSGLFSLDKIVVRESPKWTESDFQQLLYNLGCSGYGWLRPEGVKRKLEEMAADWQEPKPLVEEIS